VKHYEAREGVPADLARPATERDPGKSHASGGQGTRPLHPSHSSLSSPPPLRLKRPGPRRSALPAKPRKNGIPVKAGIREN